MALKTSSRDVLDGSHLILDTVSIPEFAPHNH